MNIQAIYHAKYKKFMGWEKGGAGTYKEVNEGPWKVDIIGFTSSTDGMDGDIGSTVVAICIMPNGTLQAVPLEDLTVPGELRLVTEGEQTDDNR